MSRALVESAWRQSLLRGLGERPAELCRADAGWYNGARWLEVARGLARTASGAGNPNLLATSIGYGGAWGDAQRCRV